MHAHSQSADATFYICFTTDARTCFEAPERTRPSSYVEGHDEHGDHEVGRCQAGNEHVRHVDWSREDSEDGDENQEVAYMYITPNIDHVIYTVKLLCSLTPDWFSPHRFIRYNPVPRPSKQTKSHTPMTHVVVSADAL